MDTILTLLLIGVLLWVAGSVLAGDLLPDLLAGFPAPSTFFELLR